MLSQTLGFDFEIILTLDELVLIQIPTIVITIIKLVLSQKLVFDFNRSKFGSKKVTHFRVILGWSKL